MLAPDLNSYVQALVDYVDQTDRLSDLEDLRDRLFTQVSNGDGKTLVNSSVNGKSMGFWLTMPAEQQFYAVCKAIKIYQNETGSGQITFLDFSRISDATTTDSLDNIAP
jgi:hypothetical protein